MIVALSLVVFLTIFLKMRPVRDHLALQKTGSAFNHFKYVISKKLYLNAFLATTLLATGGFMLMPFGAAYAVNNLGRTMEELPLIYGITGLVSMISGPISGKLTDKIGAIPVFFTGSLLAMIVVLYYCSLSVVPLWLAIVVSATMFVGVTARMISSQALLSTVPNAADRGAFMSVNSSVAQISGGIAAGISGLIVHEAADGKIENYPILGTVVAGSVVVCAALIYWLSKKIKN
jgi:predicted MFS family arabinose efflux permease